VSCEVDMRASSSSAEMSREGVVGAEVRREDDEVNGGKGGRWVESGGMGCHGRFIDLWPRSSVVDGWAVN
jgi:hypothetical protein